jgi:hypothetical protein
MRPAPGWKNRKMKRRDEEKAEDADDEKKILWVGVKVPLIQIDGSMTSSESLVEGKNRRRGLV